MPNRQLMKAIPKPQHLDIEILQVMSIQDLKNMLPGKTAATAHFFQTQGTDLGDAHYLRINLFQQADGAVRMPRALVYQPHHQ